MKNFVEWLTAQQYRMVLLTVVMLLPPLGLIGFGMIGQAVVVLAVLLRGGQAGVIVAVLATVLMTIPALISGASAVTMLLIGIVNLAPALALALVLERSRSLSLTIQVATVAILAAIVVFFVTGSPVETWQGFFDDGLVRLGDRAPEVPAGFVLELSRIMTGLFGAMTLLTSMAAVFIARWWQSALSNPGAFGREFKGLRMGMVIGLIASVVFILAALIKTPLLENLTLVLVSGFLLHGLAVMHVVAGASAGVGSVWLVAVYALLIVAMPFAQLAVAGLGFLDNWFDLRSRVLRR